MGTAVCYKQVSPTTLAFLINNPEFIESFVEDDFTEESTNISGKTKKKEWLEVIALDDPVEGTDTDYAWNGIFYILEKLSKGEYPPIHSSILGTAENSVSGSGIDFYYWAAKDVKKLTQSLNIVSEKDFLAQYDGKDMNKEEIYRGDWEENDGRFLKPYLWENFIEMRNYYKDAADRNNGMIMFLS